VNFVQFKAKHLRHQDDKTQKSILAKKFPLCLSAFVALFSGLSGFGSFKIWKVFGFLPPSAREWKWPKLTEMI
jgi:hypothetical protein